jgi:hypothetical protein
MMKTLDDYLSLVTSQHRAAPRFLASLAAVLQPIIGLQQFVRELPAEFDLDLAVGEQLDAVGRWIGISRKISIPLVDVFFSFDNADLGFDLANWSIPFYPSTGLTSLDDVNYRMYLRLKISANRWDGRAETAGLVLSPAFPSNVVVIEDLMDMSMIIAIAGPPLTAVQRALLSGGYLPMRPMGVEVQFLVPSAPAPMFAFDVSNGVSLAGFDAGCWAVPV